MLQLSVLELAKPALSRRTLTEMFCVCTVLHGSHQPRVTIEYLDVAVQLKNEF